MNTNHNTRQLILEAIFGLSTYDINSVDEAKRYAMMSDYDLVKELISITNHYRVAFDNIEIKYPMYTKDGSNYYAIVNENNTIQLDVYNNAISTYCYIVGEDYDKISEAEFNAKYKETLDDLAKSLQF